jgi:hypothetical protein
MKLSCIAAYLRWEAQIQDGQHSICNPTVIKAANEHILYEVWVRYEAGSRMEGVIPSQSAGINDETQEFRHEAIDAKYSTSDYYTATVYWLLLT